MTLFFVQKSLGLVFKNNQQFFMLLHAWIHTSPIL